MRKARKKRHISSEERARLRRQARINFGYTKKKIVKRGFQMRRKRKGYRQGKSLNPMKIAIGAAIYGAVRQKASNALAPITAKVPLGSIADEVVLGGLSYLGAKKLKGIAKDVCIAGMTIEAARIGEALISGAILSSSSTSSGNIF